MASTSASSVQKSFKYDVFLSFRGEDTRKNFIDHLYHALHQKNIYAYKDDEEIKKGERISDELIRSIEDSKFYIIVFSKNYASSSWCLDELVKIMECQKMNEQTAYPVFFDVEPTEVRKQSGAVGEAFTKLKEKEADGKWRDALREAAELAGWELKSTFDGHEAKLIQNIVEEISLELRFINSSVDGKLIGMDTRIEDIVSSLEFGIDDVRLIGINGMGGAGKTTLARAVYDKISFRFEGSSFVENVREFSKGSLGGLKSLQKQVLLDVLNDPRIIVNGVYDGKKMMKKLMCGRKVLVVLDDVDHIDQLEALAGELNWFKPGSRVIITTRDKQVLVAHRVNMILDVNLLSNEEAIFLFIRYAFRRDIPNNDYEMLSHQVIRYAAGLPLTIKVLGSFLCGKDEPEWIDAIERLKTIPLKETLEILEVSYNSLEEDYKEIFLDVACILKGWKKEKAIRVLESLGYYATNGLKVLEQKSLITISSSGHLGMHDHIEEMGKSIVRRLHPNEPYRHSRLWIEEEIKHICFEEKGTNATRCIQAWNVDPIVVMKGLRKMKELKFLDMKCISVMDEDGLYLPNGLRYLSLYQYNFSCLPKDFHADNLVGLEIRFSTINQLWEGGDKQFLKKLRFIDLHYCMLRTMDLSLIMNLERLHLKHCVYLEELHLPLESLIKLKSFCLYYTGLKTLNLNGARNLEKLYLSKCKDLVELHMPVEILNLKHLRIQHCKLNTLNLTQALNIETLTLEECEALVELYMPVEKFKLGSLVVNHSKLRTLDLTWAHNLDKLHFKNCDDLVELRMPDESLGLKSINFRCSKLRTLYLGMSPYLECLEPHDCYNLVEIHAPIGCLRKLVRIKLRGCVRFPKTFVANQAPLMVGSLAELHLTARSLDTCPLHPNSNLPKFQFECIYSEHLPSLTGNLEKLISFGTCTWTKLMSFSASICGLQCLRKLILEGGTPEVPKEIDRLECLEELALFSTKIEHLPDRICMLKHLKTLRLKHCSLLKQLPKDLGKLECLEELDITDCISLRDIPSSICEMKCLKYFNLLYCILVEKLPKEIGRLKCLKELNITGTCISHLPRSIFQLKGLLIVGSRWRLQSYGFTSVMKNWKYKAFCYV